MERRRGVKGEFSGQRGRDPFYRYVSKDYKNVCGNGANVRSSIETKLQILHLEIEERLHSEASAGVVNSSSNFRVRELLGDLIKSGVDCLGVGSISLEAEGLTTGGIDLVHNGTVGGCGPGEEDDRIAFCEAQGGGAAGPGTDAGDDSVEGAGHGVC